MSPPLRQGLVDLSTVWQMHQRAISHEIDMLNGTKKREPITCASYSSLSHIAVYLKVQ